MSLQPSKPRTWIDERISSPFIVFLFQFLHFSQASLVMKEMNSETHSWTVSLASLAILALSGSAFFIILPMLAMGKNLEQLAEFLNLHKFTYLPAYRPPPQQQYYNTVVMEKDQTEEQTPNYLHIYPFRFVQPYPHVYRTFAKGRWIGKELFTTLIKEFKAYPPEYYENAIRTGHITVNSTPVQPNYVLKNGDQIIHTSIRVEPPVLDLPIDIISESEDFLIINKPPSIIVHTGGGHHFNTIESLLKYEYGFKNIHVLHRLDKCTSGLLIFAKEKGTVAIFHEQSEKQTMKKMYFARVGGEIKWEEKTLSAYIECISHKDGVYKVTSQIKQEPKLQKKLEQPNQNQTKNNQNYQINTKQNQTHGNNEKLTVEGKKIKKVQLGSDIKDSKTLFKKIWYDEATDSTLLECYPITGRTHQIRVHLQYLGHPILNDVGYGGRFVGNGIIKYIEGKYSAKDENEMGMPHKKLKPSEELNAEEWDYQTKPWEIMLHSYQYKFAGKSFSTKLPYWFEKDAIGIYPKKQ